MSTSSKYSNNKLIEVILNGTHHIVIKSYITASFEFHRKKAEYHMYWYNENAGIDPDTMRYKCLSNKKMGKKEVKYFSSIINDYRAEIDNEDGAVWTHKKIGFNKSKVLLLQTRLKF